MAIQEFNTSNERFKEAKKRYEEQQTRTNPYYSETLSSDPNSVKEELNTLRDFIKKNSELMGPKRPYTILPSTNSAIIAANRNNKGQDILTSRIIDSQVDTTNAIKHLESTLAPHQMGLKPINHTIERISDNPALKNVEKIIKKTALVEPVKIDDSRIAQENTLEDVAVTLNDILKNLVDFSRELIGTVMKLVSPLSKNIKNLDESDEERQGWLTKWVEKTFNYIKGNDQKSESFADIFAKLLRPVVDSSKKSLTYLAGIYHNLSRANESNTEQARDSLNPKVGMFAGISSVFSDTIIDKASKVLKGIGSTLKKIGELGESELKGWKEGKPGGGILTKIFSNGSTSTIGLITRFIGLFGSIASVITLVVGSVAFASAYSMFKHPEQLFGMLGAFTNLFTEVVVPAFEWISKEIIPPLSVAFSALMVAADYLLDTVGTYVNEKLIFLIGTAIPDVLKMFGRMIDDVWQGIKDFTKRIAGIFGVGEYAGEGFIKNLLFAFLTLEDHLLQMVSEFATEVIKSLGLADVFGLKDGEGIWGRIKRFFSEDIPNFAISLFDQTVEYIQSLKPVQIMEQKIKEFITAITNIIPTWKEIKEWMLSVLPQSTPDFVKNWFKDQLKEESSPTSSNSSISKSAADANKNSISILTNTNLTPPTIVDNVKQKFSRTSDYVVSNVDNVKQRVDPIKKEIQDYTKSMLDPFIRSSRDAGSVVFAPTTNNTNSVQNTSSNANRAIGSASPPRSRLDDMIFRANPY